MSGPGTSYELSQVPTRCPRPRPPYSARTVERISVRMPGPLVYETRGHESEGCPPSSGVAPSESEWATLQLRGYPALLTHPWVVRSPPSHPGSWPCSVGCRRGGDGSRPGSDPDRWKILPSLAPAARGSRPGRTWHTHQPGPAAADCPQPSGASLASRFSGAASPEVRRVPSGQRRRRVRHRRVRRTKTRPPRDPSSEPLTALSNGVITMTAPHIVDPAGLLGEALAEASPDLMRSAAAVDHQRPAVRGRRCRRRRRVGAPHARAGPRSATATATATWTPASARSTSRSRKLRKGTYFPEWLLERRKRAESALITVVADCYLAGVSHPADGQAGQDPGDRLAVEVPGLADGDRPRPDRRGVPPPPAGRRRPVHVRGRRRADDEGPRRRPGDQRRGPAGDRRQRRRAPRGPRHARGHQPRPDRRGTSSSPTSSPAA